MSEERIDAAIQIALQTAPYLRDVVAAARFVVTDKVPTAACDKYWRVYFNPKRLEQWTPQESAWVVLHECAGHLLRRHHMSDEEYPDVSPQKINIAQDLEIESWEWPGGPAERPEGGLHPSQYGLPVGLTWREYLSLLPEDDQSSGVGDSSGEQRPVPDCGSGSHGQQRPWELGAANAPVKPGSASERLITEKTAGAIVAAAKQQGSVPQGLSVWADQELTPPPIDWRRVLRNVVAKRISTGVVDMIGPPRQKHGLLVPRWRAPKPRIAIVADTSGSMSDCGGAVLGTCVKLCRTFGAVDICWCDTEPVWQICRTEKALKPVGGGGTDITPAILQARGKGYDAIVIITDCMTPWPEPCNRSVVLAVDGGNPPANWRTIDVN